MAVVLYELRRAGDYSVRLDAIDRVLGDAERVFHVTGVTGNSPNAIYAEAMLAQPNGEPDSVQGSQLAIGTTHPTLDGQNGRPLATLRFYAVERLNETEAVIVCRYLTNFYASSFGGGSPRLGTEIRRSPFVERVPQFFATPIGIERADDLEIQRTVLYRTETQIMDDMTFNFTLTNEIANGEIGTLVTAFGGTWLYLGPSYLSNVPGVSGLMVREYMHIVGRQAIAGTVDNKPFPVPGLNPFEKLAVYGVTETEPQWKVYLAEEQYPT